MQSFSLLIYSAILCGCVTSPRDPGLHFKTKNLDYHISAEKVEKQRMNLVFWVTSSSWKPMLRDSSNPRHATKNMPYMKKINNMRVSAFVYGKLLPAQKRYMSRSAGHHRDPHAFMANVPCFLYTKLNNAILALIKAIRIIRDRALSLAHHVSYMSLIAATLFYLAMFPSHCSAANICMPVPTFHGIGQICVHIGQDPVSDSQRKQQVESQIPIWVNPQQIPCGKEGNIFTRAGLRPQTLLRDAAATIRAAAAQRLEVIRRMESWTESEYKEAYSLRTPTVDDRFNDPYEDIYGVADIPRSQLLADTIDPVDLAVKASMVAVVFRRSPFDQPVPRSLA